MTDGKAMQNLPPYCSETRKALIAARDRCELGQSAFTGAFAGCIATLGFGAAGIIPPIASALATALLCGLLLAVRATPRVAASFFTALYGGSFCGMTQVHWLSEDVAAYPTPLAIALLICLAVVCSLALLAVTMLDARSFAPILSGYGGRLGAIAAVAAFFLVQIAWLGGDAGVLSAALTAALFVSLAIACGFAFMILAMLDARATAPIAGGYGGRLGAIAAVASVFFVQLLALLGAESGRFHGALAGVLAVEPRTMALDFLACLVGTFGTLSVLRQPLPDFNGVAERIMLASVFALFGLTALDLVAHSDMHMAGAFYAGCFLGMSTPERVKGWAEPVLGAFVLNVVLLLVESVLPGVGGGLGLAAFVTVALLVAISHAIRGLARTALARGAALAAPDPLGEAPG